MRLVEQADDLFRRSKQEAQKAQEAMHKGDRPDAVFFHREKAVRYYARALAAQRAPSFA